VSRRVFVTGAAGFIGGATARLLRERGDQVVAVVRDPARAADVEAPGTQVVVGDLGSESTIRAAMSGCDAVIHLAGTYTIGIPASERPAMYEANVALTERVLDAAISLGIPRIVTASTCNVFGNTRGRIVDEKYRRDPGDGFLSYYDETKYRAHVAAKARISTGAPIVIVMPGTVYGPNDHSAVGELFSAMYHGKAHYVALGDAGVSPTYVDDLAGGVVAAMERGRSGDSYVLAGENMRLRDAFRIVAHAAGRRPPRLSMPSGLIRLGARIAPNGGRLAGLPPNLAEIARASLGVTYWASSAKAQADLGYRTRDLERGARDAYGRP
jgi:dihydroflavonol-4-reductase